jgi:hypothetical protein
LRRKTLEKTLEATDWQTENSHIDVCKCIDCQSFPVFRRRNCMPIEFKAPLAAASETPAEAAAPMCPATPHLLADQPQNGYQSPLVDALLEHLRQARVRRQTPH